MRVLLASLAVACAPSGPTFGLSRSDAPADVLTFNNGTEPEFLDPSQATGHPDARIIAALFDGLTEYHPEDLSPQPGLAERWDTHPDGRGYTFTLREDATWSDGEPITTEDVLWSWEHVLRPVYLARYAQQLYMIEGAEAYNQGRRFVLGTAVEDLPAGTIVEGAEAASARLLAEATIEGVTVPEGTTVLLAEPGSREILVRAACPDVGDLASQLDCEGPLLRGEVAADVLEPARPSVDLRVVTTDATLATRTGFLPLPRGTEVTLLGVEGDTARVYAMQDEATGTLPADSFVDPRPPIAYDVTVMPPQDWAGALPVEDAVDATAQTAPPRTVRVPLSALVVDVAALGLRARDPYTLDVRLRGTAPYFLTLTSHTTLRLVPQQAWETHGSRWTRPENIVTSGPFLLTAHDVRDKFVLDRNPTWWGVEDVALRQVVAFSIDSQTTSTNMYRAGYTDLVVANDIPGEFVPMLQDKEDYAVGPALSVYFYRLNTDEPPLDDPRVRRALSMAIDRSDIVKVTKAGQIPADHIVPPGLPGYGDGVPGPHFDPEGARELLAEAGYPGGEGFPEISILYNTLESHKLIAAVVQAQWKKHLGITIQLENREWKTYLKAVVGQEYSVARAGWIGDFVDPLTFLELWITDGGNNNTGWGDPAYDEMILASGQTPDPEARLDILRAAEAKLNEEMPFIPIYWYVWYELRQPDVRGWYPNVLDQHPLQGVSLDR